VDANRKSGVRDGGLPQAIAARYEALEPRPASRCHAELDTKTQAAATKVSERELARVMILRILRDKVTVHR